MPKIIYQAVTKDKYELPIAQADSARALSLKLKLGEDTVSKHLRGVAKNKKYKFIKIEVDDE
ncbi:MAG: hypothetical protein ACOX1F_00920 [Erysipelotrichaceae bacterium]|jgi:hypothetical protein